MADESQSGVDYRAVEKGFELLCRPELVDLFYSAVSRHLTNVKQDLRYSRNKFESPEMLRQFMVLFQVSEIMAKLFAKMLI